MKKTYRFLALAVALIMALTCVPMALADAQELTTVKILCQEFRPGHDAHQIVNKEEYPAYQKLAEDMAALGIQFEIEAVAAEQYETVLQTRFAVNDLPDIIWLDTMTEAEAVNYGKNGYLADVNAMMAQYDPEGAIKSLWDQYWGDAAASIMADNGAIYWFPYLYGGGGFTNSDSTLFLAHTNKIRVDWLEKIGETYKMTYTVDELYDILVKFRAEDVNGNGEQDEVIGYDLSAMGNLALAWGLPNALVAFEDNIEGKDTAKCFWYDEDVKDYIAYMQKLYDAGLLDADQMNDTVNDQLRTENKTAMYFSYATETWSHLGIVGVDETADYLYAPIYLTANDEAAISAERVDAFGLATGTMYAVAESSEVKDKVVEVFKYIYTPEYSNLNLFGVEGVTYDYDADGNVIRTFANENPTYWQDPEERIVPLNCCFSMNALPALALEFSDATTWGNENGYYEAGDAPFDWLQYYVFEVGYENIPTYRSTPQYSLPNDAEQEVIDAYSAVLDTYSKELLTDLIMGNRSLDDLDDYIGEMKAMGLDELIAVYQARYDRFLAAKGQ